MSEGGGFYNRGTLTVSDSTLSANSATCFLVASDADYLPLIKAVRQLGKQVYVLAYGEYLTQDRAEFEYVLDRYVDLGKVLARPDYYRCDESRSPAT